MAVQTRRTATADFCAPRRRLLLAMAATPLATALPQLGSPASSMSVADAIAWLHQVGLRSPLDLERISSASRHG